MRAWWTGSGWMVIRRGMWGAARVHWSRIGRGRQWWREKAKVTRPRLSGRMERLVWPAGQRAIPACQSTVKALGPKVPLWALRPVSTVTGATRVIPRAAEAARLSALGSPASSRCSPGARPHRRPRLALGAVAGVRVIGRVDALGGRGQLAGVLVAQTPGGRALVVLIPQDAQDLHLGQVVDPGRGRVGVDRVQQALAVGTD